MITFPTFDNQEDSMLHIIQNLAASSHETMSVDCLQKCANDLESKDSGINLPLGSVHSSSSDIRLTHFVDTCKNEDLSNIDFSFMKIANIVLENIEDIESESKGITSNADLMDHALSAKTDYCVTQSNTNSVNIHKSDNSKSGFPSTCSTLSILKKGTVDNLDVFDKQIKACEQCSMTFRYKRHLDRHLEGHQKNNCTHCNAKFARRKHLEAHLFRAHGERITKYPHSCDLCSRSFPKRILLNRHRAKHEYENGRVCSECGEMLKAEVDDKEHKENYCVKKHFKCNRCLQTFSIEQTYLSHIQNHENHKCSECDVTFASKKKVHEHFKLMHSTKLENNKVRNGVYFCADCRHTFFKKDDYFRHLESVSHLNKVHREIPIRPMFACSICSKKLISQRALDQHIRRIHKECGKAFKRNSLLKRHKLSHQQHRPFACVQCNTAFKRSHHLTRHLETCHRITLEKKKKVVKLMKTEDGHLVPVPEKPKKLRSKDVKMKETDLRPKLGTKVQSSTMNTAIDMLNSDLEFQSAFNPSETQNLSAGLTNLLPSPDMIPQVLSLVDVSSGQVVTVEVATPEPVKLLPLD
ncbi:hypothetical protein KM043_011188 [Ampulex compressa]|nr:hypothetical protein KM043_011188 [Ampulex compressa]